MAQHRRTTDARVCAFPADEIDAIAPKRDTAQREMERRIVAQLLTCLDDLAAAGSVAESADSPRLDDSSTPGCAPPGQEAQERSAKHVIVIGGLSFSACPAFMPRWVAEDVGAHL